jgi:hypothetical protein
MNSVATFPETAENGPSPDTLFYLAQFVSRNVGEPWHLSIWRAGL